MVKTAFCDVSDLNDALKRVKAVYEKLLKEKNISKKSKQEYDLLYMYRSDFDKALAAVENLEMNLTSGQTKPEHVVQYWLQSRCRSKYPKILYNIDAKRFLPHPFHYYCGSDKHEVKFEEFQWQVKLKCCTAGTWKRVVCCVEVDENGHQHYPVEKEINRCMSYGFAADVSKFDHVLVFRYFVKGHKLKMNDNGLRDRFLLTLTKEVLRFVKLLKGKKSKKSTVVSDSIHSINASPFLRICYIDYPEKNEHIQRIQSLLVSEKPSPQNNQLQIFDVTREQFDSICKTRQLGTADKAVADSSDVSSEVQVNQTTSSQTATADSS